jgi:hypothetical protein
MNELTADKSTELQIITADAEEGFDRAVAGML